MLVSFPLINLILKNYSVDVIAKPGSSITDLATLLFTIVARIVGNHHFYVKVLGQCQPLFQCAAAIVRLLSADERNELINRVNIIKIMTDIEVVFPKHNQITYMGLLYLELCHISNRNDIALKDLFGRVLVSSSIDHLPGDILREVALKIHLFQKQTDDGDGIVLERMIEGVVENEQLHASDVRFLNSIETEIVIS